MLVTLVLLAILTMGAVSASEDVASDDDGLAVVDEDASVDAPVEEVETDDVLSSEYDDFDFDPYVAEDNVYLEDDDKVISITPPDVGNLSVSVYDGSETSEDLYEITQDDADDEYFSLSLSDLGITEPGVYLISATFISPSGDETVIFEGAEVNVCSDEEIDDGEFDSDDGVIIYVPDGDEAEYDLENEDDLNAPFAFVSVEEGLDGRIAFIVWSDEEEDDQELFSIYLQGIANHEDDEENEGFTVYKLSLYDLGNYEDLIEYGSFKLAFFNGDDEEIDSHFYSIDVDGNSLMFWKDEGDDDEGIHGEGDEIEAEFTSANILDNGVVVTIPVENVPQDVDNEFTVVILQEDDEPKNITFRLDEILEGDNYIIRVNDLQVPEFRESYDLFMFLQFYSEGEKAYYAEYWDDEFGIHIYESPCIFDETSLLCDDDVITIQEIPDGVDEFTVIISKEGSEDIVNTFKFSEMDIDEDEVWVALKLEDLGITEVGDYEITVRYSDDLIYTGTLNVNKNVDIRGPDEDDEGNPIALTSIDQRVVNFRISGSVTGYVKIYVGGTQVGGAIDLDDLHFGGVPPEDGRQVILNDLNITESGDYTVKVELYSDADELLGEAEYDITVEVGESRVEINEGSYPYGSEANDEIIEYTIGSPLAEGQHFNIYFNGIKAGEITTYGLEFNDEFTVPMFDVSLFKPGSYEVNVTFFDGESETDVATGSFSINELVLTSDKEVYVYDDGAVIISFNADSLDDGDILRAYYVYDWGPVGRDDNMIFPGPYGGREMKEDGMYNDGVVSFDVAHFVSEPDNDNYRLDVGDNLIYLVYVHDGEAFGGFITVTVREYEQCIFMTSDENINPQFDVNTEENVTGNVIVKLDDDIIKTISLEEIAEYSDSDGRWHHGFTLDWTVIEDGIYTVTIIYEDEDGIVIDSRDFDIVIEHEIYEQCIFMTTENVNPHFDVNTPSNVTGKVIIKNGDIIIKEAILDEIAEYNDEDDRWHHDINVDSDDLDEGEYTIAVVYEDGDGNVIQSKNFDIVIGNPVPLDDPARIFIMWSDWPAFEKVEYDLDSTDMIHIYPNDDDSEVSDIRIVVKIGDKVYLDATLAELNLEHQINDHDELYYTIGPAHFTEDIAPGHYDNVIAYYYSPKYNIVGGEDGMPTYANLFGDSSVTFDDIEYTFGDEGTTTMVIDGATVSQENITVDNHPEAQIALQDNVITVSGLDVGNYILRVVTTPINEYYRSVEASANITVKSRPIIPVDPELAIAPVGDVEEGTNVVITISALANFTGSVKVLVGGVEVGVAEVTAGSGTFTIGAGNLTVGENTVKVVSEASENFTAGEANVTFTVTEKVVPPTPVLVDPELAIAPVGDVEEGTNVVITISALANFTGSVKVLVGGVEVGVAEVTAGSGTFTIGAGNLTVGENTVFITSEASENFTAGEANVTFTVTAKGNGTDAGSNVTIPETVTQDGFDVVLPSDATGSILVSIDGKDPVSIPLVNGVAKVDLSNLTVGNHTISIKYEGDGKYSGFEKSACVQVTEKAPSPVPAKIVAKDLKAYYNNVKYSVTVYGTNGKVASGVTVVFKVNGKKVGTARTDAKGVAVIKLKQLPKTYKITSEALGVSATKKLTVMKVLTLKKVKVKKSARKLVITATLKEGKKPLKGKSVTFKFNGKTYKKVKTNKKGVAKITVKKSALKKLKVGKKVKYQVTYVKSTVKRTVKVIK